MEASARVAHNLLSEKEAAAIYLFFLQSCIRIQKVRFFPQLDLDLVLVRDVCEALLFLNVRVLTFCKTQILTQRWLLVTGVNKITQIGIMMINLILINMCIFKFFFFFLVLYKFLSLDKVVCLGIITLVYFVKLLWNNSDFCQFVLFDK